MRVAFPGARYSALFVVLWLLSPVAAFAEVAWPSGAVLKFSTTGVPVWATAPAAQASVATSGGAAALRATQALNVGGVSMPIQLSRVVSASNLAVVARAASRLYGPLALAGLALTALNWQDDQWIAPPQPNPAIEGDWGPNHVSYGVHLRRGTPAEACIAGMAYRGLGQVFSHVTLLQSGDGGSGPYGFGAQWLCHSTAGGEYAVGRKGGYVCPNGGTLLSDGRCQPAGDGSPATDQQLESAILQALEADPSKAGQVLDAATAYPQGRAALLPGAVTADGATMLEGPSETTTEQTPAGLRTRTVSTTYNITYNAGNVTVTETKVTTIVHPDSSTETHTTTTAAPAGAPAEPVEDKECGLPGTPPCKIDEEGTPQAADTVTAGQNALTAAFDARDVQVSEQTQRESFGWVPTLPTLNASCSTISVGNIWTFDPCPGVEIGRTFFTFLWGFFGLIYCWRRVGETVAGGV